MFGNAWKWAGKFRTSEKNIGVPHWEVAVKVRGLCEDEKIWIESRKESPDEIVARFHHRLVFIHPFANGNSRHARLAADLLITNVFGLSRFSWGQNDLITSGKSRSQYLEALRAADGRDYFPLIQFVRR